MSWRVMIFIYIYIYSFLYETYNFFFSKLKKLLKFMTFRDSDLDSSKPGVYARKYSTIVPPSTIMRSNGISSNFHLSLLKWNGASKCVPQCSENETLSVAYHPFGVIFIVSLNVLNWSSGFQQVVSFFLKPWAKSITMPVALFDTAKTSTAKIKYHAAVILRKFIILFCSKHC